MAKAPVERRFAVKDFEEVEAGIVKWPMSVIRLSGEDTERIICFGRPYFKCMAGLYG